WTCCRRTVNTCSTPCAGRLASSTASARPANSTAPRRIPDREFADIRYKPYQHHAEGGLGDLFLALDLEVGRKVALKRLKEAHARNGDARRFFVREGELTAKLKHPGIIPIFGLGEDATGIPYYTMPFIQ